MYIIIKSLCCKPQTNVTLFINYTSIKEKKTINTCFLQLKHSSTSTLLITFRYFLKYHLHDKDLPYHPTYPANSLSLPSMLLVPQTLLYFSLQSLLQPYISDLWFTYYVLSVSSCWYVSSMKMAIFFTVVYIAVSPVLGT